MSQATAKDARTAKAALRRQIMARRSALSADQRAQGAAVVAERVGVLLAARPSGTVVSGFLPIGDEIDPRPGLQAARRLGCRICLPVMVGRNEPLLFRVWTPGDPTIKRQWGIEEPEETAEVVIPDVLLVPLLAFDGTGGRLGYGGGYFDRTLAVLRSRCVVLACGIAFDVQRVDLVPLLDYDERLDWVLTPSEALRCPTAK
jgi:5-formyltetrahydrofolate cyclo-ligase